jgi:Na+/proline symporter
VNKALIGVILVISAEVLYNIAGDLSTIALKELLPILLIIAVIVVVAVLVWRDISQGIGSTHVYHVRSPTEENQ